MIEKHFVTFQSPGTFVAEETTKEIESWDTDIAMKMADDIVERHGATPYGFYFTTKRRKDDELDSKTVAQSGMYFLGGQVQTREEIEARNDPKENILRDNMRVNEIDAIIVSTNSWKWTRPFEEDDVVLDYVPPSERG